MASPAAVSRTASAQQSIALRAARLEAQKKYMGRTASGNRRGLSTQSVSTQRKTAGSSTTQDRMRQFNASRHAAQRYAAPSRTIPSLQETSASLRESDTDQEDDADELEAYAAQIADENDEAETLQLGLRARSRAKSATEKSAQKSLEKHMKEIEQLTAEMKSFATNKGMSLFGQGEELEVADTTGTTMSFVQWGMTFFKDSISDDQKTMLAKVGLPINDKFKIGADLGTVVQALAMTAKITFILFLVVFIFLTFTYAHEVIGGVITTARQLLLGI